MVMAVRCPSATCRKYMLVEAHQRGTIVACLICKKSIPVPGIDGTVPKLPGAPIPSAPKPVPTKPALKVAPAPTGPVLNATAVSLEPEILEPILVPEVLEPIVIPENLEPILLTDDDILGLE
ncbi:MAG: hypothetical protein ACRC8S_13940 [Fimbriiglobus sp.]